MLSSRLAAAPGQPASTESTIPMAKRSRLTSRPGQRRPTQRSTRPATDRVAPEPPIAEDGPPAASRGALTSLEEARAAELESRLVAQEKAAAETARRSRDRARTGRAEVSSVPLSVRAASEYAYVRRDVVRILKITALLLAIMAALYVLINMVGVGGI